MLYSGRKFFTDANLVVFAKIKEACRRSILLASIGGVAASDQGCAFCDICHSGALNSSRLDFNFGGRVVNKRKVKRVRRVVDAAVLKDRLLGVREEVLIEHPLFKMIGAEFLCPQSSIKKVCEDANYVSGPQDFTVELREGLKDKFL